MMINIRRVSCGVLFAALAIATHHAAAQFPGPPPRIAVPDAPEPPKRDTGAELSEMKRRYHLSNDQAEKIRGILEDQDKKVRSVLKDESLEFPDRLAKLKSLRQDEIERVSDVLDAEQRSQYQKDRQPFPPPPPAFF